MGPLKSPQMQELLAKHLAGLAKTPQTPRLASPMVNPSPWAALGAKPFGTATPQLPGSIHDIPRTRGGI